MPSNVKLLAGASGGEPTDANFKNVTLLLHGDGSNGAQNNTFIDSSTNNFTITRNGNTTQGSFSPYGSNWSNYFDGSGDYLTLSSNAAFGFGTGDFTVEFWVYLDALPSSGKYTLVDFRAAADAQTHTMYVNSSGYLGFFNGSTDVTSSSAPMSGATWTHIAYSRASGTLRIYVNGAQAYSASNSIDYQSSRPVTIGAAVSGIEATKGYISNFRILKGTGLYTSTFTPPTQPLTAITNTSLLTCAYNRFRDGSTNNFTITRNGDVKVTNFAPFAPSSAYSTTTNGGSIFADGNGDYLLLPSSSNLAIGTSQFWVEAWVYMSQAPSDKFIILGGDTNNNSALTFRVSTTQITLDKNGIASWNSSSTTIPVGAWAHVAIGRDSSNTVYFFLNGNVVSTTSVSDNFSGETRRIAANSDSGTYGTWFNGYISGARIVKGSCLYTSSFTPPTSPVSAVTNTQLLLNATNAAIFDNSMKNDLETVGNAQISTSVKKFGTGSMAFDGNGDYLIRYQSLDLRMGGGNFTAECWVYPTSKTGWRGIFYKGNNSNQAEYSLGWEDGVLTARLADNGSFEVTDTTTLNAWNHVAYVRNGTTFTVYINGVSQGTATSSTSFVSTQNNEPFIVGYYDFVGNLAYFQGYIDDLRITKGVARYTANFTPPTAPFPNK